MLCVHGEAWVEIDEGAAGRWPIRIAFKDEGATIRSALRAFTNECVIAGVVVPGVLQCLVYKRILLMTRKSGLVSVLVAAPFLAGLLVLSGCDSGPTTETDTNRNPKNEKNREAMDYMRQQYESKQKKK